MIRLWVGAGLGIKYLDRIDRDRKEGVKIFWKGGEEGGGKGGGEKGGCDGAGVIRPKPGDLQ